jgi:hypothetical protein
MPLAVKKLDQAGKYSATVFAQKFPEARTSSKMRAAPITK